MEKYKVKMLSTQMGVHDGELHPVPFVQGEEYDIGPDLLQAFVSMAAVEMAEPATPAEEKSAGAAPADKAFAAAPENKKKK